MTIKLACAFALTLTACVSAPPPKTASGRLELMLNNVRADCVRAKFANSLVDGGYSIKSSTEYQIVAGKITQDVAATILLSSGMSGPPEDRLTLTFIPQAESNAIRVIFEGGYVSNPGTAFESFLPIDATQADQDKMALAEEKIETSCAVSSK